MNSRARKTLPIVIIFIVSFVFFFILQYSHTLADPDSFYHAKMALLMKDQIVVKSFPWLGDFTVLGEAYTDQHYLYHLFLIPFVSWLNPITGLKLATVILASLLVVTFYLVLSRLRIPYAPWFSLSLLIISPLVFRVSLAKAPSFSLIIFLLGIYFIVAHRWKWLLALSFIYVWAYGGFALIVLASGLYLGIKILTDFLTTIWSEGIKKVKWLRTFFPWDTWRLFLVSLFGVAAGVVINPYFPQNLQYYRYQLYEIGVKNYQKLIGVGSEWYPYDPLSLMSDTVFLTILFLAALAIFIVQIKKQTHREVFFLALAIIFLQLTLKSRRYVEYYVPLSCLFGSVVAGTYLAGVNITKIWNSFVDFYTRKKIIVTIIALYFLVTVPTIIIKHYLEERSSLTNGIPYTKFQKVGQWLGEHSEKGDIVFHSSWDEFPMLFYHDDVNNYIGGLDATFNYLYDKDIYQKWVDITTGDKTDNLHEIIKNDFRATYVLASQKHNAMKKNINDSSGFRQVYEDSEAVVYKVLCCGK